MFYSFILGQGSQPCCFLATKIVFIEFSGYLDICLRISDFNFFDVFGENTPEIGTWEPVGGYFYPRMAQEGCRAIFTWECCFFVAFFDFSSGSPDVQYLRTN
jgi:hypothetical protein